MTDHAGCTGSRMRGWRQAMALGLAAGAVMAMPMAAIAQQQVAQAEAGRNADARAAERPFEIPAQPLIPALVAFSDATGLQLFFDSSLARGLRSPGISGTMSAEAALRGLLAGTGMGYRFTNPTTVTLTPPGVREQDGGALQLDPITVAGAGGPPLQAEIGNLPPAYAGGQVARGGKVGLLGNRDFMETPFSQTSFTSQLIQDQQAQNLGDIVDNDPALALSFPSSAGIDNFRIRGFDVSNPDIGFNGLYGVAPTEANIMAAEAIERVEVLRGPDALLNGISPFNSIGGAINVVPKRAGNQPLIQFTPSYASDGQLGGHLDVGRRFGRDKAFGVRFNGLYRTGDTAIEHQSQETQLAALGLDYQGTRVRLSADLGYQSQDMEGTRRPLMLAVGIPVPEAPEGSYNYGSPWTYADNRNFYGTVRAEVDLSPAWTAYLAGGGNRWLTRTQSENARVLDAQGSLAANPFAISGYSDSSTVEAGMKGNIETGPVRHDLALAGTIFRKEQGTAIANATIPVSSLYDRAFVAEPVFGDIGAPGDAPKTTEQENGSLALADTLSILEERVLLTVGMRWQRVGSQSFDRATGFQTASYRDSAITPAVGLVVRPIETVSLYANYIEGLSQGSTAPAAAANAGEVFAPTVTKQYEAGIKLDLDHVAATLSAFQITQPNAFTDPTTNVFGVDGEQRNRGLEFTAFGEVAEGIRIIGGATLLDAELTKTQGGTNDGNRPSDVPRLQAKLAGEWDTPFLSGLTLTGRAVYTASKYVDQANTQQVPAWTRFDLGARYVIARGGREPIVVRATVRNLADADYWATAGNRIGLSEPRTFLLSTTFSF